MTFKADLGKSGSSFPLGSTVYPSGVNFSVYSHSADAIELLLFDRAGDAAPARIIKLNSSNNRTGDYWHVFVSGCGSGQLYGYRVRGPFAPQNGYRCDPEKVLLDPYGKCISSQNYSRVEARAPGDNAAFCMKSAVVDFRAYDWEGDLPLRRPFRKRSSTNFM